MATPESLLFPSHQIFVVTGSPCRVLFVRGTFPVSFYGLLKAPENIF